MGSSLEAEFYHLWCYDLIYICICRICVSDRRQMAMTDTDDRLIIKDSRDKQLDLSPTFFSFFFFVSLVTP
jgi:hypothetical protein